MMMTKTVLIAGASGLVGSAALEYFLNQENCNVIAASRRHPEIEAKHPYKHISTSPTKKSVKILSKIFLKSLTLSTQPFLKKPMASMPDGLQKIRFPSTKKC